MRAKENISRTLIMIVTITKKCGAKKVKSRLADLRNVKAKESKGAGAEVHELLALSVIYNVYALVLAINAIAWITEDAEPHAAVWGPVGLRQITPSARIAFNTALPEMDKPRWSCHARPTLG